MRARRQKGMTLPEVLIALLVFAAIASTSVYALRLGVDSRDQLEDADNRLKGFQLARTLIKEDLAQVVNRPVRDEFGQTQSASFLGNLVSYGGRVEDDEKLLISFVRNGWVNPNAEAPRSSLQYIEYVLKGGALIRRARIYLDEYAQSDDIERILFEGLDDARASFLIGEQQGELAWADIWPVSGAAAPPLAVSITFEERDQVPLEQYFWLGEIGGEV
ncbi:type II secretion system minor pseudopilin GspJ [Hyphococcus flavus]|uniref:Type II secretion system protein J n=1 Tax=Hyphococcus flavus TaxID=1866326 RepID=A0AAE9ZIY1_9PROT|nr:type II secretion system minor pseudopilin GspJ [Hyphococcus flavus]WDI31245.1 type II secretion system minor pseudopilin GspJ [Hyphococcus flavus]